MTDPGLEGELAERVRAAGAAGTALRIHGAGSKSALGRPVSGDPLDLSGHRGIAHYAPTELVLTARAGTPLREIEVTLAGEGQILPFEPPQLGPDRALGGTLGGVVACGLSGPARPYRGAARDFVLGTRLINGRGETMRFGGEVMKNVAGYDVSRLMVGAQGTLGVLTEISLKVLPAPEAEQTLAFELEADAAIARMNRLAGRPLPLTATCYVDDQLFIRLSGTAAGIAAAYRGLGGEPVHDRIWGHLRRLDLPFFERPGALWRLGLPATTPQSALAGRLPGRWLIDWGGAQRWYAGEAGAATIRRIAAELGGHATAWRGPAAAEAPFQPLGPGLAALHRRLKQAFDPAGILNPGRLYPDL